MFNGLVMVPSEECEIAMVDSLPSLKCRGCCPVYYPSKETAYMLAVSSTPRQKPLEQREFYRMIYQHRYLSM